MAEIGNIIKVCTHTKKVEKQRNVKANLGVLPAEKILSVRAKPFIINKDITGSRVEITGYVNYNVLYIDQNSGYKNMEYKVDFTEFVDIPTLNSNSAIMVMATLLEVSPQNSSNGNIDIDATINISVQALFNQEIEPLKLDDYDDNFCYISQKQTACCVVKDDSQDFFVGNRIDLGKNFAGVINVETTLVGLDYYCSSGVITVCGQITTNILYGTTDENNPILNKVVMHEFKQEIECEGATEDMTILAQMSLFDDKVTLEVNEGSEEVLATYPIRCEYILLNSKEFESVIDAYSLDKEVEISTEKLNCLQFLPMNKFQEQIHTSLILEQDYQSLEKIIGYDADNIVITKAMSENGEINFEGICYSNIIYISFNQDKDIKTEQSIVAEIPFSYKLNLPGVESGDEIILQANISDFDARIKRAQELDIFAQIKAQAYVIKSSTLNLTSKIEFGEDKKLDTAGISIYMAEQGTTEWDLAKRLCITTDQLYAQNPELTFPLNSNQKIVVYRGIKNN